MFSGIAEVSGVIEKIEKSPKSRGRSARNSITLRIRAPKSFGKPALGASVAVNGCCLTIVSNRKGLAFDLLHQTWELTAFSKSKVGDRVNLERPLRLGQEIGGHFVLGHVDGTGKITSARKKGADRVVTIKAPKALAKYLFSRASIAVDGVSLTVAKVSGNTFTVWIIPHTARLTTLGWKRPGDLVNLEADMILKFVRISRGTTARAK